MAAETSSRASIDSTAQHAVTGERPELARLHARVVDAADAVGEFIAYWGFKAVYGRIWTLLALSARPLSQAEIARRLSISRSLVSESVAELIRLGLIRTTGPARQARLEAVMDVWPTITDILRSREWMLLERARVAFESAREQAELAQPRGTLPYAPERIRLLLAMTELAQGLLRILIAIRTPRAVREVGGWFRRAGAFVRRIGAGS